MDETKKIITEMLKENTGSSILDSGGAYGRHWEKNQSINLENKKTQTVFLILMIKKNPGKLI